MNWEGIVFLVLVSPNNAAWILTLRVTHIASQVDVIASAGANSRVFTYPRGVILLVPEVRRVGITRGV